MRMLYSLSRLMILMRERGASLLPCLSSIEVSDFGPKYRPKIEAPPGERPCRRGASIKALFKHIVP